MKFAYHDIILGAGLVGTPLAPATRLGWELYSSLVDTGLASEVAVLGGIGGAICVEAVGAIAGYVGAQMYHRGDQRWYIGAAVLVLYAAYGVYEFGFEAMGMMFVFAACLYVLAALLQSLKGDIATEQASAEADQQHQRNLQRENAQREHELKMERARLNHEAKLAKITANTAATPERRNGGDSTAKAKRWNQLSPEEIAVIVTLSPPQIAAQFNIPPRTARDWKRRAEANAVPAT